jgi:prepilin-type N-terminal cleavage/methylation domain-containing protein/prepilin-type processing-associated H-X9-DG protein
MRRAFTLVELLVVLAIIGILAAILFPVFGRARESGRSAACSSNLKQLGLAFQQYLQDTGGRYPGAGQYQKWGNGAHWVSGPNSTDNAGAGAALAKVGGANDGEATGLSANVEAGSIYKYIGNSKVYICPSLEDGDVKKLTYSMNCAIGGVTESRVKAPSDIVLLMDEEKNTDGYVYASTSVTSTDALTQIHNGGGNILFCDGHVKFFSFDEFQVDKTDTGRANKTRTSGTPRFYDLGLGAKGYFEGGAIFGSCALPCEGIPYCK